MSGYTIGRLRGGPAIVYYEAGKRHRYALGTADPREAERRAPALYSELSRPKGKGVAELWDAYVLDMQGRAVISTMKHTWKALRGRFGPMSADEITVEDCRAHTAERRKADIKDGTIHTELGHLRMVVLWAAKRDLIPSSLHRTPIEAEAERAPPYPSSKRTPIELAIMPHVRLFIVLAVGTAARKDALLGLTWDRCDFERE